MCMRTNQCETIDDNNNVHVHLFIVYCGEISPSFLRSKHGFEMETFCILRGPPLLLPRRNSFPLHFCNPFRFRLTIVSIQSPALCCLFLIIIISFSFFFFVNRFSALFGNEATTSPLPRLLTTSVSICVRRRHVALRLFLSTRSLCAMLKLLDRISFLFIIIDAAAACCTSLCAPFCVNVCFYFGACDSDDQHRNARNKR